MTNNNSNQFQNPVFSGQPHSTNEQILPTSGPAAAGKRTNNHHPAWSTRLNPLDAENRISRVSSRLPADRIGEWPHSPTHQDPNLIPNIRNRPDTVPTHSCLSGSSGGRASHQRQVVALLHYDTTKTGESRPSVQRPGTAARSSTSGRPGRGEPPIDPDNSRKAFMHGQRPRGGVRQDKGVLTNASPASPQPAPDTESIRVQFSNNGVVRSQAVSGAGKKSGRITLWGIDPAVKAELERIAFEEGLSLSQVGKTGLGEWVHQRLHDRHEALLYPVLRQLIRDELRTLGNRLVFFLMRIAFAAEQTRILVTNILNRFLKHQGVPDETFHNLVDKSNKMAKRNIIARTPEMKSLMEEWFSNETQEKAGHQQKPDRKEKT